MWRDLCIGPNVTWSWLAGDRDTVSGPRGFFGRPQTAPGGGEDAGRTIGPD